jgi:hypothetical protein
MTKGSDLRDVFGMPSQAAPLFMHNAARRNRHIGSLDTKVLKSTGKICAYCNNTRTQPHDRAWEQLSKALRTRKPSLRPGETVRVNKIFSHDTSRMLLNVHLYFVKLFGCHVAGNNIPIDLSAFSDSIMNSKAHAKVYLNFGCGRVFAGQPMTGMSDMWLAVAPAGAFSPFATWFYDVEGIWINVMFADEGQRRQGLVGAWHPRFGTTKLVMTDYSQDAPEPNRAD